MTSSNRGINNSSSHLPAHGYVFFICLAILPCAALGGIIGMAFRITLHVKDMELGRDKVPKHEWRDTSQMRRIEPHKIWLKAGLFALLGILIFGSWMELCVWPLVR
jgi:hypothetical protein